MKKKCFKGSFCLKEAFAGQAGPALQPCGVDSDNAPAKRHLAAFTLIELLVVVLIIGILAAVAVPQYKVSVYKSRYATLKHLADALAKAEEVYYLANGKYTDVIAALDVDLPGGKNEEKSTASKYVYDWGSCWMKTTGQLACTNNALDMQYQIWLNHHPTNPNIRNCIVLSTTDLTDKRNQVCKIETGRNSGMKNTDGNFILWPYQ